MSGSKKARSISARKRQGVLKKAEEQFRPVLETVYDELGFVLTEDDDNLTPGARTTAVLPLSGFIELFGDLIENENYSLETYKQRSEENNFGIPPSVFNKWREAGCLRD